MPHSLKTAIDRLWKISSVPESVTKDLDPLAAAAIIGRMQTFEYLVFGMNELLAEYPEPSWARERGMPTSRGLNCTVPFWQYSPFAYYDNKIVSPVALDCDDSYLVGQIDDTIFFRPMVYLPQRKYPKKMLVEWALSLVQSLRCIEIRNYFRTAKPSDAFRDQDTEGQGDEVTHPLSVRCLEDADLVTDIHFSYGDRLPDECSPRGVCNIGDDWSVGIYFDGTKVSVGMHYVIGAAAYDALPLVQYCLARVQAHVKLVDRFGPYWFLKNRAMPCINDLASTLEDFENIRAYRQLTLEESGVYHHTIRELRGVLHLFKDDPEVKEITPFLKQEWREDFY